MSRFHRCYCASPAWVQLARMTLVPAVLEGTDLASGLDLADRGTL